MNCEADADMWGGKHLPCQAEAVTQVLHGYMREPLAKVCDRHAQWWLKKWLNRQDVGLLSFKKLKDRRQQDLALLYRQGSKARGEAQ